MAKFKKRKVIKSKAFYRALSPADLSEYFDMHKNDPVPVLAIDCGDNVICDWCGEDWTNRPEPGGAYGMGTKAICPLCVPSLLELAKEHAEEHLIESYCPEGMSFADWVRNVLR